MVNQIGNPFSVLNPATSTDEKSKNDLGQDEFLTLMLAQMRHQDPMNPMENGEFIAQLAQFRTVTGVDNLNKSFNSFSQSMQSSQALQASTLVGREVLIPGNRSVLPVDGTMNGSVNLPAPSQDVRLNIYNMAGVELGQLELGAHPGGQAGFAWNGQLSGGVTLPPGNYQIQAQAVIGGRVEVVETMVAAKVESVSLKAGREPVLNLANVGPIGFSQVSEIR